jgi:uncharacterized protein
MNRLHLETSPYLLQHAHNPVHWYAWKPEALEAARRENKLILLSIGYATCHWCHVMERESFENEAVAAVMNKHFICIKVDREERPDIDHIYMQACTAVTGQGGWPLNVFLTPDRLPITAGTYFPAEPAYGRRSWTQVLGFMAEVWRDKPTEVLLQAQKLTQLLEKGEKRMIAASLDLAVKPAVTVETVAGLYKSMSLYFDRDSGGVGGAPKFPNAMNLKFLLEFAWYSGDEDARCHGLFSLDQMILGGIYDVVGGGFSRYATDEAWLVPHFEKMLYDNALLLDLLATAWKTDPKPLYKQTIYEIIGWLKREMQHADGGFYSAMDADSEGVEGKYYVWSYDEVKSLLDEQHFAAFCRAFDLTLEGNWEHNTILWRGVDAGYRSQFLSGMADPVLREALDVLREALDVLHEVRCKRVPPITDDKQILAWNAMLVSGLFHCGLTLGDGDLVRLAEDTLDYLIDNFSKSNGGFYHTLRNGVGQHGETLEDRTLLCEAVLWSFKAIGDAKRLTQAQKLTDDTLLRFGDESGVYAYMTREGDADLVLRPLTLMDQAEPSGNATLVHNLLDLAALTGESVYQKRAESMVLGLVDNMKKHATGFGRWASAVLRLVYGTPEITVLGYDKVANLAGWHGVFVPPYLVLQADDLDKSELPEIRVCYDQVCLRPVGTIEQALLLVKGRSNV